MQPLAVSLTLEEYRQSLMGSAGDRQAQQQAYEPSAAAAAGSGSSFLLSHSSLSSVDLEAMRLCTDCRYPCYLRCAWAGCRRPPSQPAVGWGQQQAADWGGAACALRSATRPAPSRLPGLPAHLLRPACCSASLLTPPACYLPACSGMPTCEAGADLRMWDADSYLKPRGFDAAASLRLAGVAGECGCGAAQKLGTGGWRQRLSGPCACCYCCCGQGARSSLAHTQALTLCLAQLATTHVAASCRHCRVVQRRARQWAVEARQSRCLLGAAHHHTGSCRSGSGSRWRVCAASSGSRWAGGSHRRV